MQQIITADHHGHLAGIGCDLVPHSRFRLDMLAAVQVRGVDLVQRRCLAMIGRADHGPIEGDRLVIVRHAGHAGDIVLARLPLPLRSKIDRERHAAICGVKGMLLQQVKVVARLAPAQGKVTRRHRQRLLYQFRFQPYDLLLKFDVCAMLGEQVQGPLQGKMDAHLPEEGIGCCFEFLQFLIGQDTPQVLGCDRPDQFRVVRVCGHFGFLSFSGSRP
jgi:hypothetical protein